MKNETSTHDIRGRQDIILLVDTFYQRIRQDDVLGHIFTEIAHIDWDTHLPKMVDFWDTVIFGAGSFRGNPIAAHARLVPLTDMGKDKFDRWFALFQTTVDDLFEGAKAEHIKNAADDMANVIYSKINHVPDPRFDPANLTPEQRARYTRYKQG